MYPLRLQCSAATIAIERFGTRVSKLANQLCRSHNLRNSLLYSHESTPQQVSNHFFFQLLSYRWVNNVLQKLNSSRSGLS